jgi:primosomal protein N'
MWVLEVIPFTRAAPAAPLSYRSSKDLAPGTLISIPLRKRIVTGLVVGSMPVREAKAELKKASFSLSASSNKILGTLPLYVLTAAKATALYHATTLGAVLYSLLIQVLPSSEILEQLEQPRNSNISESGKNSSQGLEAPFIDRIAEYTKIISTNEGTTLLVVPTQIEADEWSALLKAFKPIVVTGKITGERREAALARASSLTTPPQLIITTPNFSWIPLPSLSHIIIERISAGSYTLPKRPYVDVRYALQQLAQARAAFLTYGDYPLPIEYRVNPAAAMQKIQDSSEVTITHTIAVLDTRTDKKDSIRLDQKPKEHQSSSTTWRAVPEILRNQIKKTTDAGGTVAVLAARRGYAPSVVCSDCGTAVTDEFGRNLALATINGTRVLRSSDGKISESAATFCKTCGGWNLLPLGIGIERVEEELREAFPNAPIVRIDQDSQKKSLSLKKLRAESSEPGTISIGTELMLPILSPFAPVNLGIIASADSLLAVPFWRSRERFIRVGLMLAERSERMIIATRKPDDNTALASLIDPTNAAFWQEETTLRKILSYPPFGTLVVFHVDGSTGTRLEEARALIKATCLPYIPFELATSLVLHIPENEWPNKDLSIRLASLSPAIRITINSEMLW